MEITSFAGLPAHPLLVHVPVVLIPLAALSAIVTVAWRARRGVMSLVTAGLALAGALGAILAAASGEPFEHALGPADHLLQVHAELGETLRLLSVLFAAAAVLYAVHCNPRLVRIGARSVAGRALAARGTAIGLALLLIGTAALGTTWTVRTGHAGAKAVWSEEWTQATHAEPAAAVPAGDSDGAVGRAAAALPTPSAHGA